MAGTVTATKPLRDVSNVGELLVNDHARKQLQRVAAKHLNPERLMRVVANAMRTTKDLDQCHPMSLLGALMNCAALGLEPNTQLGHAYLIPFKNKRKKITEVQLIIGYKGFADLARRSGLVVSIHSDVVYSDDELWSFEYGSNMHLKHRPGPQNGEKLYAYCYAKLTDGEAFCVLPWTHVMHVRDQSQGWRAAVQYDKTEDHPWHKHEDRMAAKTALRALANRGELPMALEFLEATDSDDKAMDYASFAANPDGGLQVADGETIEGTVVEETEADPPAEEKPKAAPRKKAAAKANQKTERKADDPAKPDGPPQDAIQHVYDRIVGDLADARSDRDVDTILEMSATELEQMAALNRPLHDRLMEEVEEAKAALQDAP